MIVFLLAPQRTGTSIFLTNLSKIPEVDIHNEPLGLRYLASNVYRKLIHHDILTLIINQNSESKKDIVLLREPTLCFLPIHEWFSNSKFIHIKRNKNDWIQSCLDRPVSRQEDILVTNPYVDKEKQKTMTDREKLEEEYDIAHEIPDKINCLHLTYEEMCINPEETSKKVCNYLEVKDHNLFQDVNINRIGISNVNNRNTS